jgi:hypothetical protein
MKFYDNKNMPTAEYSFKFGGGEEENNNPPGFVSYGRGSLWAIDASEMPPELGPNGAEAPPTLKVIYRVLMQIQAQDDNWKFARSGLLSSFSNGAVCYLVGHCGILTLCAYPGGAGNPNMVCVEGTASYFYSNPTEGAPFIGCPTIGYGFLAPVPKPSSRPQAD